MAEEKTAEVKKKGSSKKSKAGKKRSARPNTDTNIAIQLVVGALGTLALALVVFPLKGGKMDYFYGVINERGPVQYAELFMSFMIVALVAMKTRIMSRQLRVIAQRPVPHDVDLNSDEEIQSLRENILKNPSFSWSILLVRVDRILALWLSSKDVSRVSDWASSESERDMMAAESTYSLAKVLIWAIPIMGFIGTVLGLGSAISGFSSFLAGSAELSEIKGAITEVTVGLGVAFDTTLLALVLSVLIMFPLSNIQRKEDDLFVEIDNYLDDTLISRFPAQESQPIVIENLEDSIEAAFRRYIPDPDRYEEVFTRAIDKAARSVEERFTDLTNGYEAAVRDMTKSLSGSFASATDNLSSVMHQVVTDMNSQEETLMAKRKEIATEELNRMKTALTDIHQSAMSVAEEYRNKAEELAAATRDCTEKSLAAANDLADKMQKVTDIAAHIEDLLHIQKAVEETLKTVTETEAFQQTMRSLQTHLAQTDEFCKALSQPRTITLTEEPFERA